MLMYEWMWIKWKLFHLKMDVYDVVVPKIIIMLEESEKIKQAPMKH